MTKLIGVDLGTTGVRADLYNLEGEILASGRAEIRDQTTSDWETSIKNAFRKIPDLKGETGFLTVQGTSGTIVLVDEMGASVINPVMYHERARKEAEELRRLESVKDLLERGVPISSTSPTPKILKIKRRSPRKFKRTRWIISPTTWLLYRLHYPEGEKWVDIETDWTNALKFGEDVTQDPPAWHRPFFEEAGIDLSLFPRIVRCGKEIGEAQSRLSKEIGVECFRLFQGMTDGNATGLGIGCLSEGDFGFSCGTTTAVKYVSNRLKPHPSIYYHRHPLGGFMAGAAPYTAGFIEWFSRKILGITVTEALRLAEKAGDKYCFFPQGDRSPFYDPDLGASLINLWPEDEPHDSVKGSVIRSMVLGLSYFENYYVRLFEHLFNRSILEVKITGGGARSRWWNLLRASIYERPVVVMEERPGIGALIPITLEQKLFKNSQEAGEALLKPSETFNPDKRLTARYSEEGDVFMKRWKALRGVNHLV